MALRGGGPAVVILLKRGANAATLADDWTATHEFLHLGVPRLPPEDSWLFEGLATYYTELTRARAGLITSKQAYQHLLEGFERGRHGGSGGGGSSGGSGGSSGGSLTLREESAQMRERHSFYRVYWAGAAIAFLADVAARRAGTATLDGALRSFAACCASSEHEATADSVLAALAAFGATRLTTEAQRWLDSKEFPDVDEALRTLGVTFGGHGAAVFGRAPNAAIRDAIMARSALP
jgi:predicted metalloprotease with PDZ domain